MNQTIDSQFRTGYQALVDMCRNGGVPAEFCLANGNRFCAVVDNKVAVYRDGNNVRIDCAKATENDRRLTDAVRNAVNRLVDQGYAFPA